MSGEDNKGPVALAATDRYALAIAESDLQRVMQDMDELIDRNAVPVAWVEAMGDITRRCTHLAVRIREEVRK